MINTATQSNRNASRRNNNTKEEPVTVTETTTAVYASRLDARLARITASCKARITSKLDNTVAKHNAKADRALA